ncbi:hypothetical protein AVEN_178214-1 [Araneus ventricosus]|uniref:Uncharacterized protein n=1 Tax=Araneus ventricosus TaxID=182803 RepID=A0A4Y2H6L1_ARAVE|nr:hypothetical protein AVEN_178214-1 [Araneus ventricosus]
MVILPEETTVEEILMKTLRPEASVKIREFRKIKNQGVAVVCDSEKDIQTIISRLGEDNLTKEKIFIGPYLNGDNTLWGYNNVDPGELPLRISSLQITELEVTNLLQNSVIEACNKSYRNKNQNISPTPSWYTQDLEVEKNRLKTLRRRCTKGTPRLKKCPIPIP